LGDKRVNSGFQLAFPARPRFLRLVLRIALSLAALAGDDDGQAIFPAQLVAHIPYAVVCPLVGNVLAVVYKIDGAKDDVIMDMALIYVRRQDIFVLSFGNSVGKLPPDLVGFLIVNLSRLKGLYQVKG